MPNYVVGHKIPDSDSICSAIALSYLKTTLGEDTIPARLGDLSPETLFILDKFILLLHCMILYTIIMVFCIEVIYLLSMCDECTKRT